MFLDTTFPPDSRVENEAISLIQEGHEVFLFSLNYDKRPEQEEIRNIKVRRYPAGKLVYKFSALAYTLPVYHLLVYPKIVDFIKEVKPHALHVHDMVIARAVFWANRSGNLPVVLDLHENRPVIMKEYSHLKKFPGKYMINTKTWAKKQVELMQKADKVVLVTEEAMDEAISYGVFDTNKFVIVPNTLHVDVFCGYPIDKGILKRFENTFNIVYTGDTGLRRGTDTAIMALNILKEEIPNVKLILVGQNSEDVVLHKLVKSLKLEDYVTFEGWQDVTLFPSYIEAAEICICPLKRNLHHDTTFANKIFQYMAIGKPIVASDCPAQKHVLEQEECGLIHEAGNENDLAEKILTLYHDSALKKQLGKNGYKAIESRWNWDVTKKQLINLYETIV
ncbi:glycosyltransferase family 4 protein [Fulvivirga kasyanovii]|nr:glycosyltransferase family 4 protein [Fulvivirga kasyanovii]